jgi:hypothetical protein
LGITATLLVRIASATRRVQSREARLLRVVHHAHEIKAALVGK